MTHLSQIARRILLEQNSSAGQGLLLPDSPMGMLFARNLIKPLNLRQAADAADEAHKNVLKMFKDQPGQPFTQKEVDAYAALSRFVGSAEANAPVAQLVEELDDVAQKWKGITTTMGFISTDEVRNFLEAARARLDKKDRNSTLDKSELFMTPEQSAQSEKSRQDAATLGNFSGSPIQTSSGPTTSATRSNTSQQDAGWQSYIKGDKARQRVWDAWVANREKIGALAFPTYVMWWKDASRNRRFSDGRKGSINATVQLLRKEAGLPPEDGT